MNSFYPNSYYKNQKKYKSDMISKWKRIGVIYDDFDDLYAVYVNTMNCSHCLKEFKNSKDRHLDHDHQTGLFRKIVCSGCNNRDSYLKYPPQFTSKDKKQKFSKEYYEANRDKLNQKGNCFFCNKYMIIRSLRRHYELGRCVIKPIT